MLIDEYLEKIAVVPHAIKAQRRKILGKFLGRDLGAAEKSVFSGRLQSPDTIRMGRKPTIMTKAEFDYSTRKGMIPCLGATGIGIKRLPGKKVMVVQPHYTRTGAYRSHAIQKHYLNNNPEKLEKIFGEYSQIDRYVV